MATRIEAALRAALVGVLVLLVSFDASAQAVAAVVGQSLAWAGLAGGLIAGGYAGWRRSAPKAFWPAFGIYLGVLAVAASTRSGDMAILPLALALGSAAGVLPFAVAYFAVRWCWIRIRRDPRRDPG